MEKPSDAPTRTPTKDLLDLAEFPLGLLAEPRTGGATTVEYKDGGKTLKIIGHPQFGLPTPRDMEVYLVLQETSERHGFSKRVPLSRAQVLKTLGWSIGSGYERLELSLNRWQYTRYQALAALHDPKTGDWVLDTKFGIIERVHERRRPGPIAKDESEGWFEFTEAIRELLIPRYLFRISAEEYLRLKSPIAQAEYRYLAAKRCDGKKWFGQHLVTFAREHLGLRQAYPSKIKEKLAAAHTELLSLGFVTKVEYGPAKTGEHQGELKVVFFFPQTERFKSPAKPATNTAPVEAPLSPAAPSRYPGRLMPGKSQVARNGLQCVAEASSPLVNGNGTPEDEELPLVKLFRRRQEERE